MRCLHRGFVAFLIFIFLLGFESVKADKSSQPRSTWEERDAKVLAFSPDGRTLVTSGSEGTRLREIETGRVRAVLNAQWYGIEGVTFSPDARLLFAKVVSERYKPVVVYDLKVWNVRTGEAYASFDYISDHVNVSTEHYTISGDGKTLAFLENSARLPMEVTATKMIISGLEEVTVSYNSSPGLSRVKIWDIPGWKQVALIDGGSHLIFSPDGKTLVTGSQDGKIPVAKVWDAPTGTLRTELIGKAPWVKPMTFSPDGKLLAIGGPEDQTLWELASGKKWMVADKRSGFNSPQFSRDGHLLFPNGLPSGNPGQNMNQEFPCYDLSNLPPRNIDLGEGQSVVQPLTYKEGRLLVSLASRRIVRFSKEEWDYERTVVVGNLSNLRELGRFRVSNLIKAEFSPDGRTLAILSGRHGPRAAAGSSSYRRQLELLDPVTGRLQLSIRLPEPIWDDPKWKFSSDGKSMVVIYTKGTSTDPDISERPKTVDLWDLEALQERP